MKSVLINKSKFVILTMNKKIPLVNSTPDKKEKNGPAQLLLKQIKKPNLFIVGVPRAGTTSLYNYLKEHPEVFMSPVKGPNYFGEKSNNNFPEYHKNEKKYSSLFKGVKNEKIIGEASHLFNSKKAPKQIKNFNRNAKIIISLRNPPNLIESHFNIYTQKKGEEDFEYFMKSKDAKEVLSNLEYSKNLKRYLKEFRQKNVHIMIFENFSKNPKKEFDKICEFLKISKIDIDFKKYNKSRGIKNKWILKLIIFIPRKIRLFIKRIFSNKLLKILKAKINKITTKKESVKSIDETVKKHFFHEFRQEIKSTDNLINKNLNEIWK